MPKTTMEKEEQLGAWPAQACGFAVSASLSRDAGRDHQQQAAQQEPPGLSVYIECYQSTTWLWGHKKQGPFVREVIVSFKRSPPEDVDGSCPARSTSRQASLWKATQPQQQDGLEDREVQQPESQGQGLSLRCSGGLDDTPGQVMQEQLGAQAPIIRAVALIREQERETATDAELSEEEEWADAMDTELSEEEEWENAVDIEMSEEEEWQDATDTELSQGTDAVGSPPVQHWVSSLGLEDNTDPREGPSFSISVDREAAGEAADKLLRASPAPVHPADVQLADFAPLVASVGHCTPLKHEKAEPPASSAPMEAARAAGTENEAPAPHGPTADGPAQLDKAESMEAEGLDKSVLVVQELDEPQREMWGQEQSENKVTGHKATAEGAENLEAGLQSPTTDAPLLLDSADYTRTEIVKRAWLMIQEPVQELEEEWEQKGSMDEATTATAKTEGPESLAHTPHSPTVDTPLLDMADYIRTDIVKRAWLMIQEPVQQPEEKWEREGSRNKVMTATARTEEAESPAHAPHSPTVNNPRVLDMAKYFRAEIVKKAHHLVQRPFQEVKEQQDWKQSPDEVIARPAGCAYRLFASTVINTPPHEGWLNHALKLHHRREAEAGANSRCHRSAGHGPGDQK
ncbi:uncharacterized protein LOC135290572 isoform X2 [Passer domesticus]|uniref:uncharacterized protein LOC135290572 isoform X2 n=1 Tax=Passer domesticus TaxID=48849 RepID=UPI0030FE6A5E